MLEVKKSSALLADIQTICSQLRGRTAIKRIIYDHCIAVTGRVRPTFHSCTNPIYKRVEFVPTWLRSLVGVYLDGGPCGPGEDTV